MSNDLKPYENITRVFWIRIELKEKQSTGRQTLGEIKDVMSGAKQPIYYLHDIIYFIMPYLQAMGVRINWPWRLGGWLEQKRTKSTFTFPEPTQEDGETGAQP